MSDGLDFTALNRELKQARNQTQPYRSIDTVNLRPRNHRGQAITYRQRVVVQRNPITGKASRYDHIKTPFFKPSVSRTIQDTSLTTDIVRAGAKTPPPYAQQSHPKPIRSQVLHRSTVHNALNIVNTAQVHKLTEPKARRLRYSKLQLAIFSMAMIVFLIGSFVLLQTLQTNHVVAAQVSALAKKSDTGATNSSSNVAVPSTTKPSVATVNGYSVAPNLPRYLNIPELGVHARVLSLGLLSSGALATPNNVFDVGWYNESSQPGQAGAMLVDGHVSSWTTKGVFYGIKNLKTGNQLQIVRGDGSLLTYQVVKTQTYSDSSVDMKSAITPVVAGRPGLNLITCTGQVKPGTSEFNQRVIVYTEQI